MLVHWPRRTQKQLEHLKQAEREKYLEIGRFFKSPFSGYVRQQLLTPTNDGEGP